MQPTHIQDHAKEASLTASFEQTMTKLTEFSRQRAKKNWAKHGDRNSSYFHNDVSKRRRKNRIAVIKDNNNNLLYNPEDIASCFTDYFTNIFTTSSPNLRNEPPVVPAQQEQTDPFVLSVPEKDELLQILKEKCLPWSRWVKCGVLLVGLEVDWRGCHQDCPRLL